MRARVCVHAHECQHPAHLCRAGCLRASGRTVGRCTGWAQLGKGKMFLVPWPLDVVGDGSVHLALGIHLTLWGCVETTFGLRQRLAKITAGYTVLGVSCQALRGPGLEREPLQGWGWGAASLESKGQGEDHSVGVEGTVAAVYY